MSTSEIWPPFGCLHPMHDDDCTCGHGPVAGEIRAQPCSGCRTPTLSILELALYGRAADEAGMSDGTVTAAVWRCKKCQGADGAETARLRAVFEERVASGMSLAVANRVMSAWHSRIT